MPFPALKRKVVYENNPLAEVSARFVFSPLIRIENDRGAELQESLRDLYPYRVPEEEEDARELLSDDAHWKVSIGSSLLGLSTTVYTRWNIFRKRLHDATDTFVDVYGAPKLLGAQLMYRDVISRRQLDCLDEPWTALLNSSLHGELGSANIGTQVEQVYRRAELQLDECPGRLTLTHGFDHTEDAEQVYVLESLFSHLFQGEMDDGYEHLESFHDVAGRVFRWAITDELHERLEPRPTGRE